ncbi:hypothetical protein BJ165DRAFT_1512068 [Panaeolus papilionaceus]|nr:hypothetical protein BJ165DRAFT_1512068 [Panaeolus papilionaceus]
MTIFSRLALDGVLCLPFVVFFSGPVFCDAWMEGIFGKVSSPVVFPSRKCWCVNAILRLANFRLLGPSFNLRTTCSPGIVADDSFTRYTSLEFDLV